MEVTVQSHFTPKCPRLLDQIQVHSFLKVLSIFSRCCLTHRVLFFLQTDLKKAQGIAPEDKGEAFFALFILSLFVQREMFSMLRTKRFPSHPTFAYLEHHGIFAFSHCERKMQGKSHWFSSLLTS